MNRASVTMPKNLRAPRDEIAAHPGYQTMPPLATDDRDALERSIRTHGIHTPIIVDESGAIIDGHHRHEISQRVGVECPQIIRSGLDEAAKVALSISLNVDRRQLTREQKREIVARSIKAEPTASNREHARRTGADDKTVAAIREALTESAEIPHFEKRTDPRTGNPTQPASKPSNVVTLKTKKTEETTESYDAGTGEIIDPPARAFIAAAVESDQTIQDKRYLVEFYKAITKADDFLALDAERIGSIATVDDLVTLDQFVESAAKFRDKARRAASVLRPLGGKK